MNHSTKRPTKAQQARLDALSAMPCCCCEIGQPNRTEVHHLVDKGTRELSGGHDAKIPLCGWHHRGVLKEPSKYWPSSVMRDHYGPSKALHGKLFSEVYGTDRELLAMIDAVLEGRMYEA